MEPRRMYRVKEVARIAGISVRTLHHYDEIGLLVPTGRSASGYRLYDDDDLLLIGVAEEREGVVAHFEDLKPADLQSGRSDTLAYERTDEAEKVKIPGSRVPRHRPSGGEAVVAFEPDLVAIQDRWHPRRT